MSKLPIVLLLITLGMARAASPWPASAQDDEEGSSARKGIFGGMIKKAVGGAVGGTIGGAVGQAGRKAGITERRVEGAVKTAKAFRRSAADVSESEEYYIGRAVAAQILARYPANADESLNTYVQSVTQVVAMSSDRPAVYGGYHAQVVDSDEVNAFAAPGGFIFLTTGLLRMLENEDQLACVLAHELAHVAARHGIKTIKASRLTEAFAVLGGEVAQDRGGRAAQLTQVFGGAVEDVVQDLVVKGYSRDKEFDADAAATVYAARANYHPKALTRFLTRMGPAAAKGPGKRPGFYKTHPDAKARLANLEQYELEPSAGFKVSPVRRQRFLAAIQGL